jgi:plastocyanin
MRRSLVVPLVATAFLGVMAIGGVTVASATTPPTKTVTITGTACPKKTEFCYKSAALVVPRSTKVVWKNTTQAPHTVTRCTVALCGVKGGTGKDPAFHSPTINVGKTYSFTFKHPGTYVYFCEFHGYSVMHGTITVK